MDVVTKKETCKKNKNKTNKKQKERKKHADVEEEEKLWERVHGLSQ